MSKGLGKGLGAFFPSNSSPLSVSDDDKVLEIPMNQLRTNPHQPRKHFTEQSILELADSIKEHGVIQPIIVREVLRGYEIIAGERRYRASLACQKDTIPAVVRDFTEQQVMEIALIENIQREDLNPMETASAYQALIDQFDITQEQLSTKVGKSRSHIANYLRLLQLPEAVREYVSRGTLSMGHAKCLAGIKNEETIIQVAEQAIKHQWNVRELEQYIQQPNESKKNKKIKTKTSNNPFLHDAEERLRERFQTPVKIHLHKEKGTIEFSYFNQEDLERLLELLQE